MIGEIFDRIYTEGGTRFQENVQTTIVPAGGSAIVEYQLEVPRTYVIADHSIFRAFDKGALGMMKVKGPKSPGIYSGKEVDSVDLDDKGEAGSGSAVEKASAALARGEITKDQQVEAGKVLYPGTCGACHQPTGPGIEGVFLPLAHSDSLMACCALDSNRAAWPQGGRDCERQDLQLGDAPDEPAQRR